MLSLKEGSVYEELALIRALHQLITATNNATGLLSNTAYCLQYLLIQKIHTWSIKQETLYSRRHFP